MEDYTSLHLPTVVVEEGWLAGWQTGLSYTTTAYGYSMQYYGTAKKSAKSRRSRPFDGEKVVDEALTVLLFQAFSTTVVGKIAAGHA